MNQLDSLYQWINSFSNPGAILTLLILMVFSIFIFNWRSRKLGLKENNILTLDSRYSYLEQDVKNFFKILGNPEKAKNISDIEKANKIGNANIRLYALTEIIPDILPFPFAYGIFLSVCISAIYSISLSLILGFPVAKVLVLLPLIAAACDVCENLTIVYMANKYLANPAYELKRSVGIGMFFTRAKFVFVIASLIAITIGLISLSLPYLYPLRFVILFSIFLFFFPILANGPLKSLLQNLFAMDKPLQIGSSVFAILMSSLTVSYGANQFLTYRTSCFWDNIHNHLSGTILQPLSSIQPNTWTLIGAIFLSLPALIITRSRSSLEVNKKQDLWLGFAGGLFVSGIYLFLILMLCDLLIKFLSTFPIIFPPNPFLACNNLPFKLKDVSFGLSLWLLGLVTYTIVIYYYKPRNHKSLASKGLLKAESNDAPVLLFFYLLTWIWSGIFMYSSFYLDSYHIPITLLFVLFSALMYFTFGVDHFYRLDEIELPKLDDKLNSEVNLEKALEARKKALEARFKELNSEVNLKKALEARFKDKKNNQLVVIAASGGGIQAAGWTATVLCGLQREIGKPFADSIGLISSVSGGSVGAMHFIDKISEMTNNPLDDNCLKDENQHQSIIYNSTQDNLDAVGWGLAGPDFLRFIGVPLCNSFRFNDRGYAIEEDWKNGMSNPNCTLFGWRDQILKGEIPIPVFNATLVEDGRRYLISPMTFLKNGVEDADRTKAFDFNTLFNLKETRKNGKLEKLYDLDVTTAARLSASFPYVSPVARNDLDFVYNYHVTDGGYFDNSGMFTAIEWIENNFHLLKGTGIEKIFLIQINASAPQKLEKEDSLWKGIKGDKGFVMEWIGPAQAVGTVRDSTLLSRNAKEIKLLKSLSEQSGISLEYVDFSFPNQEDFEKEFGKNFYKVEQPLSWKLTKSQKNVLAKGWEVVKKKKINNGEQGLSKLRQEME